MPRSSHCYVDMHLHLGKSKDGASLEFDEIRQLMAEQGITHAALFPIDEANPGPSYRRMNDRIAEIMKKDKRIFGFCRLAPHEKKNALEEMVRCQKLGFSGVKFHPRSEDFSPSHAEELVAQAERLRMPVIIHTAHEAHCRPASWKKIFLRHPKIPFILTHGGKDTYRQAAEVAKECANVYLDTSTLSYRRTTYLFNAVGPEKIVFGSDMPYSHIAIEKLKYELILKDNDAAKRKIYHDNPEKILGDLTK